MAENVDHLPSCLAEEKRMWFREKEESLTYQSLLIKESDIRRHQPLLSEAGGWERWHAITFSDLKLTLNLQ